MYRINACIAMEYKSLWSAFFKSLRKPGSRSQKALAKITGVDQSTWARYETGERWPTLEVVTRLKRFLKVPEEASLLKKGLLLPQEDETLDEVDLNELRYRWKERIRKLEREIRRKSQELKTAQGRRRVFAEELQAIDSKWQHAHRSLVLLQDTQAATELIEFTQQELATLQRQRNHALASPLFFTPARLQLLSTEIESLSQECDLLRGKLQGLGKEN